MAISSNISIALTILKEEAVGEVKAASLGDAGEILLSSERDYRRSLVGVMIRKLVDSQYGGTQRRLAEAARISEPYISRAARGKHDVGEETLNKLKEAGADSSLMEENEVDRMFFEISALLSVLQMKPESRWKELRYELEVLRIARAEYEQASSCKLS